MPLLMRIIYIIFNSVFDGPSAITKQNFTVTKFEPRFFRVKQIRSIPVLIYDYIIFKYAFIKLESH